ncbi:MAG TPA: class I SAM-dependent methyltransferase [Solirubrobacteraceae bacterium]|nr:class I SAM-dependent methyltransferase [Solirubrobacteraceae bacterium]
MTVARAYPETDLNVAGPNARTIEFFATTGCRRYAEIGVYKADTALGIADVLGGTGEIHLFDYADRVESAVMRLHQAGHDNVVAHPNSRRLLDSYNWSLMRVLQEQGEGVFDYVFLDGAHTWAHDALAYALADRLLVPGGYLDFDDYTWSLRHSPSMNPDAFPEIDQLYSGEQIDARQVALVVDLLVRPDARYEEIVPNKIFRRRVAA